MVIILGLWVAIVGYGVLYTGVAKLGGDSSYSLAKAFKGSPPATTGGAQGSTTAAANAAAGAAQASAISTNPLSSGDPTPGGGSW